MAHVVPFGALFGASNCKHASFSIAAIGQTASHDDDLDLTSRDEGLVAEPSQVQKLPDADGGLLSLSHMAAFDDKPAPRSWPAPPPAPRLRPSSGEEAISFPDVDSGDDLGDEEWCYMCPPSPRLGWPGEPLFASAMPALMLPPAFKETSEPVIIQWDDNFGFVFDEVASAGETDGEPGGSDNDLPICMVPSSVSTASSDDQMFGKIGGVLDVPIDADQDASIVGFVEPGAPLRFG